MRDSTYFSLDAEEFSTLRLDVGRGRLGRLESRIANLAVGSNGEILSNGKPVLPVEIHPLTALLAAVTWYASDGEKRGAFPSAQVLATIAECAFAGGTAFGALHLSTVKLVLEQCKSAGTGDSILGGLLAIVKPCWEAVQNSSARGALALIPSNLVRLYPNQSDLQNFIEGKSTGLLLPTGLPGNRMLRSLAGLMGINMRLTDTSHRDHVHRDDELKVELLFCCSRNKHSRTVNATAGNAPLTKKQPLRNDGASSSDEHKSLNGEHVSLSSSAKNVSSSDEDSSSSDEDLSSSSDKYASSSGEDASSSDDDIMPAGAGTAAPDLGLPTVPHELSLSTAVSAMVKAKRKNIEVTMLKLSCSYRWIISFSDPKIKSDNDESGVRLLRVPNIGHTHNTGDFTNNRHLPPAISVTNALLSALDRGTNPSRRQLKAHLLEAGRQEPEILWNVLFSFGTYASRRLSTLPGAILTEESIDQHKHGRSWASKAQSLRQNTDSSKPISLPINSVAFVCYCLVNRLEIGLDTLSCRAAGCRYGGIFHADCLQSKMPGLNVDVERTNPLFCCISCTEEGKMVPDTAALVSAISFSAIANDLQQLQQQQHDKENSVSSNLPNKNSTSVRAAALGIPSLFTGHRFSIRSREYYNFQSSIRRALRSGNTVGKDVLIVLKEYQDMPGYHVFLSHKLSDDGIKLVQLHCIIVSPQQLELMNITPAFFYLQFSDQTHCTTRTALQLGGISGIIPEAGGKAVCGAWTLWLSGGGGVKSGESQVELTERDTKDKTNFMEECSLFFHVLHQKGYLKNQPHFRILMTDKDKAAMNGSLRARKLILGKTKALCENSLLTSLAALADSASVEEIAAAWVLILSLPMFVGADCTLPKHDALPIDRDQLFSEYPNTAPLNAAPLSADAAAAFAVLFRQTWLDSWGAGVMRGFAYHVRATLIRCTELQLNASNHGMWNIAGLQLLWLECPAVPDGLLSNYILACLVFALLCLWHAKTAMEKAAKNHISRDQVLRRIALDGIYKVFAGTMSVASYKAEWHTEEKWIKYLEENWLCDQWFSTLSRPMRKLMNTLWKDCDNDSEILFSIVKHEHRRSSDVRALLQKLIGTAHAEGIDPESISGSQLMDVKDILNHMDSHGNFRRRDSMFNDVVNLGEQWKLHEELHEAGPASVQKRFFDFNVNESLRNYTVGFNRGGMIKFNVPAAGTGDLLASMNMSAKNMSKQQHVMLEHLLLATAINVDCGTNKKAPAALLSIKLAIQCAMDAAKVPQALPGISVASPATDLARVAADLAIRAHEFKIFCGADRDGIVLLNRIEAGLQYATPELIQRMLAMLLAVNASHGSVSGIEAAASNQDLRTSMLRAHPAVARIHFKDAGSNSSGSDGLPLGVPHFGLIYIVIITMSAQDWHKECLRVQGGNVQSLQFRGPLRIGYLIALNSVYSMCVSLVSAGNGSKPISAFYVGQELRHAHSSGRLGRIKEHGTSNGSSNISELFFLNKGFMCMPVGNVQLENRILAFLPPNAVTVNTMEGAFLVMFLAIPGFVSLNDSPTGQMERFLQPSSNDHPAQMHTVCSMYIASLGGVAVAADMTVDKVEWPWLGRALRGVEWLLHAGLYKNDSGTCIVPAVSVSEDQDHPSKAFSVLQIIDGLLGGVSSRKCRVSLWCMGCDCHMTDLWCDHLILTACRENKEGLPATSESPTLLFFIQKARDTMSQQLATIGFGRSAVLIAPEMPENEAIAPENEASEDDLSLNFGVAVTGLQNCFTSVRGDFRGLPNALLKAVESVCRTYKMFIKHINDAALPSFSGPTRSTRRMCNSDDIAERQATERGIAGPEMGQVESLQRIIMHNRAAHGSFTDRPLPSQVLYKRHF